MARMSLDTAIRLSAEVKGGGNIDRVRRSLQDLAKGSQTTAREMSALRAATFQFARANDSTIAGIRSSIGAFRGLQEQAKIGSREFQRYGAEIQKLEGKLRGLDTTATAAGDSLGRKLATGLAAAGIGRGLQQITMQAGKFDAEVRKAAAIEGGAGSFGVLRKEIEAVAAVAAGTPTEVAALATSLSRAGFSADQTTKALRGIVLGAEASDTAFADMGGIVGTVLKTFQVDASQTSGIVDVLVKSANSANQTVLDVGEAMSYAAGTASKLNVSVEDTAALIALFADAGVRASRAGTSLSTGLNRLQIAAGGGDSEMQNLIRGSQKMIDAMSVLGSQVLDTSGKLKPLDQTLIAIKRQMDTLNATDRAILAKAIFGEESGRSFESVLARSEQDIVRMFGKVRDAGGTAQETQKKMQGFNYSILVAGGNAEYLANQIGGMIGAAMKPLIDTFNLAISAAMKLPDPIRNIGAAAAAAGISTLGLVVAVNAVSGALALVGGVSGAKAAIAGLTNFSAAATVARNAAVALNLAVLGPWALAAAGIAAATAAAYKFNEPFREFVNTIPARFEVFFQALQRDVQAAAARAQAVIASVRNFAVNAFRAVESVGRQAMQNLLNTLNPVDAAFRQLGINIQSIFGGVFESIGINWGRLISQMLGQLNPMQGILKLLGADMAGAMEQALNFRPSAAPQAAALPATAPIPGTLPGAPSAPALPGGGGAAGGGGGGGAAKTRSIEEIIAGRPFGREILAAAKANNVDPALFAALVEQESGNRQTAISRSGAIGLSQLMPGTARELGVDPYNAMQNLMGGAKYLRQQLDRFGLEGGLRAYNQGPGAQQRTPGGNSQESREYPGRVLERYRRLTGAEGNIEQLTAEGFQSQTQATEQFREQQQQIAGQIEEGNQALQERTREIDRQAELAKTVSDIERRTLEYYFQQEDIEDRFDKLRDEALEQHKQALKFGVEFNLQDKLRLIGEQEKRELQLAEYNTAKELLDLRYAENDAMAERVRMMQQLTSQAAEPAAFQTQGMAIEAQIATLKDDLAEMTSIATLAGKSAETIGGAFGNAFRDLISGAASARQVLAGFFQDVAQGFAQMASEIIAKQMAMIALQTILKALGAVAGASSGGTFAPSNVGPFGAAGASTALSFDPSAMVPRALGGPTASGQPYKVGENGPELFVPYQAGSIIPAEATEALEAINNASLRGLSVPFQATAAKASQQGGGSSSSSGLSVPFQRGMEGLSVPFQRGGMDGSAAAGMGAGGGDGLIRFEEVRIGEMDFVTRDEAKRMARESAKQGAALALKRYKNNPTDRRGAGLP